MERTRQRRRAQRSAWAASNNRTICVSVIFKLISGETINGPIKSTSTRCFMAMYERQNANINSPTKSIQPVFPEKTIHFTEIERLYRRLWMCVLSKFHKRPRASAHTPHFSTDYWYSRRTFLLNGAQTRARIHQTLIPATIYHWPKTPSQLTIGPSNYNLWWPRRSVWGSPAQPV